MDDKQLNRTTLKIIIVLLTLGAIAFYVKAMIRQDRTAFSFASALMLLANAAVITQM